jgi:hypothetical protein
MPGIALVRQVTAAYPARRDAPYERPPLEAEHVEEVWDAELVGELPPPGWLAVPALSAYTRAGFAGSAPRIDVFA